MELAGLLRSDTAGRTLTIVEVLEAAFAEVLSKCYHLQTLVLNIGIYSFSLTKSGLPMPFLAQSLKRILVDYCAAYIEVSMTARNAIWILVFCSNLREATFSFTMNLASFTFLLEYSAIFKGLIRVMQLAIRPVLIWDLGSVNNSGWSERIEGDQDMVMVGSNPETTAVYHFLQVLNLSLLWK